MRRRNRPLGAATSKKSPAFARWFKDSVVQKGGKPRLVYHGTKAQFDEFRVPRDEVGVHFGSRKQAADFVQGRKGGHILPMYLSLQNPLRTPDLFEWTGHRILGELKRQKLIPANDPDAKRVAAWDEAYQSGDAVPDDWEERATALAVKRLKALGYDGIVYRNRYEGVSASSEDDGYQYDPSDPDIDLYAGSSGDSYVILDPAQAKSPKNRGTFSPKTAKFLDGLAAAVPEFPGVKFEFIRSALPTSYGGAFLSADKGKKHIGELSVLPCNDEGYASVDAGWVAEKWRGKGLYPTMLTKMRDHVKAQGCKGIVSRATGRHGVKSSASWEKFAKKEERVRPVETEYGEDYYLDGLGAMTSNADLDKFRFVFRKKQDGHTLSVYDGKTLVGKMGAMTANYCYPDDSPLAKYRKPANVVSAEILEPYRGRKLYQEMLLRFRKYAKDELGCAGLKSEGFQRSSMATRAWKKLNPRVEVKPDDQYGREDLFLDGLRVPDTDAFRRWFSGSKIVNKKGEPLVVYHGTKEDFDVFDTSGTRRSKSPGAMFTASKKYATNYGRPEYGGKVLAVYLRLQNPFDAKNKAHNREWEANRIGNEGWVQYAQRAGYDGAITMLKEYVVFDPRNIKSATNNSGAFDPSNPSILNGLGGLDGRPTKRQRAALDYARRAARAFYEMDPDAVRNKCDSNASLFARLLRRRGYSVDVVEGVLPKGGPHVWLEVEGKRFDPTLEPQGVHAKYGRGRKREEPRVCLRSPELEDRYADKIERLLTSGSGLDGLPTRGRIPVATAKRAMKRLPAKTQACGFTTAELREGMEVEREHRDVTGGRVGTTAKIAAAHLCERRDYYKRLKKFVE